MHDLFPMQAPTPSIAAVIKHHKASEELIFRHITPGEAIGSEIERRWLASGQSYPATPHRD